MHVRARTRMRTLAYAFSCARFSWKAWALELQIQYIIAIDTCKCTHNNCNIKNKQIGEQHGYFLHNARFSSFAPKWNQHCPTLHGQEIVHGDSLPRRWTPTGAWRLPGLGGHVDWMKRCATVDANGHICVSYRDPLGHSGFDEMVSVQSVIGSTEQSLVTILTVQQETKGTWVIHRKSVMAIAHWMPLPVKIGHSPWRTSHVMWTSHKKELRPHDSKKFRAGPSKFRKHSCGKPHQSWCSAGRWKRNIKLTQLKSDIDQPTPDTSVANHT